MTDGDEIEIGGHRIAVSLKGDVSARARAICSANLPPEGRLALTCVEGPAEGACLPLDCAGERFLLGREFKSCEFPLLSLKVSRQHAAIARFGQDEEAFYAIADLGSTNGTRLNRQSLRPERWRRLAPGDIVRLGKGEGHCDLLVHYTI